MKTIIIFLIGFILWLLLMFSVSGQSVLVGIIVAGITTYLFNNISIKRPATFLNPVRYFWFIIYLPVFLWNCLKSNIDVAYRVIHPGLPIKPGIVKVKTSLKTDIGRTFLANSITLTPGTLTVEINDDILYIHWINVTSDDIEKDTEIIVAKFEKYLSRIFE